MTTDSLRSAVPWAGAFLKRSALLALLWWMLAEGDLDAPYLAAAIVCAAAGVSLALQPPARLRWRASQLPRLVLHMLRLSLLGGWDVARRAFTPALPVQPGLSSHTLVLPAGLPAVLYTWLVSLTPGTASVALDDSTLVVHALDTSMDVEEKLRELEAQVAALFGSE
jgi:multicomponent Na+:H+ antiporter subunit E